jgi:AcrR family transcriptional regulator
MAPDQDGVKLKVHRSVYCVMAPTGTPSTMQERILEVTDRLFYRQGIRAIGVDTIAAEIGISKRTLYNHFPSKDELIVAYLSRRFRPITASDAPPVEQILGVFDGLAQAFAGGGFRGCPFVNAVAELGEANHPARRIAVAFKEQRRVWFRDLLTRLEVDDPDGVATQLALLVDGAIAAGLVRGDPAMARSGRDAARTLLEAAGVRVSSAAAGRPRRTPRHRGRRHAPRSGR